MKVQEYYNAISRGYDELYGEEQTIKYEKIKACITGSVLDVGCGTGIITGKIRNAIGIDISSGMIRRYDGIKVIGHAHYLPFKDKTFDVVISLTMLQDIKKPGKCIKEMSRVGRKVIVSILNKSWSKEKFKKLIKSCELHGRIIKANKDWIFIQN